MTEENVKKKAGPAFVWGEPKDCHLGITLTRTARTLLEEKAQASRCSLGHVIEWLIRDILMEEETEEEK